MKQVLGAIVVLMGIAGSASAADSTRIPETASMMLIGAGLVIAASFARVHKSRRG